MALSRRKLKRAVEAGNRGYARGYASVREDVAYLDEITLPAGHSLSEGLVVVAQMTAYDTALAQAARKAKRERTERRMRAAGFA